jgi:hypothetical protein
VYVLFVTSPLITSFPYTFAYLHYLLFQLFQQLEFWDIDEELSTAEEEHFMCNGVYWDPSGRMVATVVTQPMTGPVPVRNTLENGYNLWTFQGYVCMYVCKLTLLTKLK